MTKELLKAGYLIFRYAETAGDIYDIYRAIRRWWSRK
jgi:hypothetical protein